METRQLDEEAIFHAARAIGTPEGSHLDAACGGDEAPRLRIEALLRAHEQGESFLSLPQTLIDALPKCLPEALETTIGPYTLIEPIGEGGMGVVYMAEQTRTVRRKVALKIIKPGMDTKQVVLRFEAERQALAMMDHPNIARIFDGGATESGRPYFVMELVRGVPITEYCDGERLNVPDRLRLFAMVCQAVRHAHQKGVIHRDLKPSNILVTVIDGQAIPKVIDFGIAKAMTGRLTEDTLHTGFHQFVGTLLYTSPEQAALSGVDADTRSDVYSLGVILYELLTGTTTIEPDATRDSSHDKIRRMIREVDPPKPSSRLRATGDRQATIAANRSAHPQILRRSIRGELDWMVMKALDKDRKQRYQSAGDLAAEVERYLDGLPLEVGPPSIFYRFKKFARRNKVLLTTAALVALSMIAGTVVSIRQAIRATQAEARMADALAEAERSRKIAVENEQHAEEQQRFAERHLRDSVVRQASQAIDIGEVERAQEILEDDLTEAIRGGFAWGYLSRQAQREIRLITPVSKENGNFAISPMGDSLAYVNPDGELALWDLVHNRPRASFGHHFRGYLDMDFTRDGMRLATISSEREGNRRSIHIWDVRSARLLEEIVPAEDQRDVAAWFTAGGRLLVVICMIGEDFHHYFLDLNAPASSRAPTFLPGFRSMYPTPDGHVIRSLGLGLLARRDLAAARDLWSITFSPNLVANMISPDGSRLVLLDMSRAVVLDAADGAELHRVPFPLVSNGQALQSVQVGPGARSFVGVDSDGILYWTAESGMTRRITLAQPGRSREEFRVVLSPDGKRLAFITGGIPGGATPLNILDLVSGNVIATYPGRRDGLPGFRFDADSRSLLIPNRHAIKRWNYAAPKNEEVSPFGHADEAWAIAFSPDGKTLATGSDNTKPGDTIKLWDAATGKLLKGWVATKSLISSLAFSPDGKTLASGSFHRSDNLHLWDAATGEPIATLNGHTDRVRAVAFSPDGKTLASAGSDRTIRIWDVSRFRPVATMTGHSNHIYSIAFSPDGKTLASASNDSTVRLWDVARGESTRIIQGTNRFAAVAFSTDGKTLAAADREGSITLWDPTTGERRLAIHGNDDEILTMAYSPDGETIATAGMSKVIRLWDTITGQEVLTLKGHEAQINGLAFSPDGKILASCSHDGAVKLWRSEDPRSHARPGEP